MQKQSMQTQSTGRRDPLAEVYQRLAESSRLSANDKPIFAKNLGALAARVSPQDPLEGARLIVKQAGNESLWPTKRKKFFRLPDEDTPPAGKNGEYGSNPSQFKKLAEAAGELLSKNAKPESIDHSRQQCIRALVKGSTFMPTYVPADAASQSAKSLLDEYASAVAKAVQTRTRLTELWQLLRDTPILIKPYTDETIKTAEPSPYGEVADFPKSLMQPKFRDEFTHGRLTTFNEASTSYYWSDPLLHLGSMAFERPIKLFCIPPEKQNLFTPQSAVEGKITPEAAEWMASVGFDIKSGGFPPLKMGDSLCGWKKAQTAVLHNVVVGVEYIDHDSLGLELQIYASEWPYVVHVASGEGPTLMDNATVAASLKLKQHFECKIDDWFSVDVVFSKPFDPARPSNVHAIGLLPRHWQWELTIADDDSDFVRDGYSQWEELWFHDSVSGWTDDEYISKILMGDAGIFIPAVPDAEPLGGILPEGSLGAGLLQNAKVAEGANRISQMLIDRAALIADTGLRFYEAMVEEYRSAIHRI